MFNRQITKEDYPGLLNAMGNDLTAAHGTVWRMQEWAFEAGLEGLADALDGVARAIERANGAAHDAWLRIGDEIDSKGAN
ncbi:hypothetical protein ACFQBY_11535 [Promicromonospora citrea]|uniref:Uncharacterized protein n=1 Tax=Promicromonospora citrea TaxID=43677 RepID=A0A8H9GGQ1_9MICO|nr:hypothetical protein [Promicromonospora citrea]NNH53360.1 hypothetical protein [Promicromonospora citrea]GGM20242.1 hypothetical protein GCM10010102_14930 [Promicromonospora citrea]